jgi:hypothetical protein
LDLPENSNIHISGLAQVPPHFFASRKAANHVTIWGWPYKYDHSGFSHYTEYVDAQEKIAVPA